MTSDIDGISVILIRAGERCPICDDKGQITFGWCPADSLPDEDADMPGAQTQYDYCCDCGFAWNQDISRERIERESAQAVSFDE